jgi:hypothetical protein
MARNRNKHGDKPSRTVEPPKGGYAGKANAPWTGFVSGLKVGPLRECHRSVREQQRKLRHEGTNLYTSVASGKPVTVYLLATPPKKGRSYSHVDTSKSLTIDPIKIARKVKPSRFGNV